MKRNLFGVIAQANPGVASRGKSEPPPGTKDFVYMPIDLRLYTAIGWCYHFLDQSGILAGMRRWGLELVFGFVAWAAVCGIAGRRYGFFVR